MNRTDILAALGATPAQLIDLARLHPGPWFTLRGNDEGDWHGQITDPTQAYNDVATAWGAEAMIALDEPTLGLLGEDALLLLHLDQLRKAGINARRAQLMIDTLRERINALDKLIGGETPLLGYLPLWDMHAATGALTLIDGESA